MMESNFHMNTRTIMSLFDDINILDEELLYESPMFALVNPSEVCPVETSYAEHTKIENVPQVASHQVVQHCNKIIAPTPVLYSNFVQQPIEMNHKLESETHQFSLINFNPNQHLAGQVTLSAPSSIIEPPPVLTSYDGPKYQVHFQPQVNIRPQIQIDNVLTRQRRERLKARLEKYPPELPVTTLRKSNGKKLTGRERQIELEKQEDELLKMRSRYLAKINQLEQKCNKLRAILGNIVTTSPEYTPQMISYLETSELLFDSNAKGTTASTSREASAYPLGQQETVYNQ